MRLELATQNDFDAIIAFYDDVTERTPEIATYARWSKRILIKLRFNEILTIEILYFKFFNSHNMGFLNYSCKIKHFFPKYNAISS